MAHLMFHSSPHPHIYARIQEYFCTTKDLFAICFKYIHVALNVHVFYLQYLVGRDIT